MSTARCTHEVDRAHDARKHSSCRAQAEMDVSESKIRELITALDARKNEAIERTFKGVAKYFKEVFAELVPGKHSAHRSCAASHAACSSGRICNLLGASVTRFPCPKS